MLAQSWIGQRCSAGGPSSATGFPRDPLHCVRPGEDWRSAAPRRHKSNRGGSALSYPRLRQDTRIVPGIRRLRCSVRSSAGFWSGLHSDRRASRQARRNGGRSGSRNGRAKATFDERYRRRNPACDSYRRLLKERQTTLFQARYRDGSPAGQGRRDRWKPQQDPVRLRPRGAVRTRNSRFPENLLAGRYCVESGGVPESGPGCAQG